MNIAPKQNKQHPHFPWRQPVDMIESAWERNLEQLLYQLNSDTKKLSKKLEKKI